MEISLICNNYKVKGLVDDSQIEVIFQANPKTLLHAVSEHFSLCDIVEYYNSLKHCGTCRHHSSDSRTICNQCTQESKWEAF